jgi:hypothetical protein
MDSQHNTSISPRSVKPSQEQLEKAAVLAFLIFDCLNVTKEIAGDLARFHKLTLTDIDRYDIRAIPTELQNLIISHESLNKFGPAILQRSNLFYSFNRSGDVCDCFDWRDDCCCDLKTWRLDLNASLSHRGLLLPIRDRQYGFFSDLLVFRHARDQKPFTLRLRSENNRDREIAA